MEEKALTYVQKQLNNVEASLGKYTQDSRGVLLKPRSIFIKVRKYVFDFLENRSEMRWVIMPGLRGVGKTTIQAQTFMEIFKSGRVDHKHLLFFSLDYVINILGLTLLDILKAYEHILGINFEQVDAKIFIFIDEVQDDPKWQEILNSYIYNKAKNVFLMVTGSSALSLQYSADIARRAEFEKLYPMNFCEFELIKNHIYPITGIKHAIRDAIYKSDTASEAYQKLKQVEKSAAEYWAKINTNDIDEYIKIGTFPFAINKPEAKVADNIRLLLDRVIATDITKLTQFDPKTLSVIKRLLFIYADGNDTISIDKVSNALGIDRLTITAILDTLEKAEIFIRIMPHGSKIKKVNKPSKYLFMSPAYRAALLGIYGNEATYKTKQGMLLEDVAAGYFYREFSGSGNGAISYDSAKEGADFILEIDNKRKIVFEVGRGNKDLKQLDNTLVKVKGNFGICISYSNRTISINENKIQLPLKLFLLS